MDFHVGTPFGLDRLAAMVSSSLPHEVWSWQNRKGLGRRISGAPSLGFDGRGNRDAARLPTASSSSVIVPSCAASSGNGPERIVDSLRPRFCPLLAASPFLPPEGSASRGMGGVDT